MLKALTSILLLFQCIYLSSCAPPAIPTGASVHLSPKGVYWTWTRRLESGCAAWMAKEAWANVQLLVDSRCEEWEPNRIVGRGVIYPSVADHLVFVGYWPWTQEEYFNLMEFDNEGAISGIRPCPHALSESEIDALRALAQEALAEATTEAEKRVLARVDERLAATNGAVLASGQMGCTDLPPDWHHTAVGRSILGRRIR